MGRTEIESLREKAEWELSSKTWVKRMSRETTMWENLEVINSMMLFINYMCLRVTETKVWGGGVGKEEVGKMELRLQKWVGANTSQGEVPLRTNHLWVHFDFCFAIISLCYCSEPSWNGSLHINFIHLETSLVKIGWKKLCCPQKLWGKRLLACVHGHFFLERLAAGYGRCWLSPAVHGRCACLPEFW